MNTFHKDEGELPTDESDDTSNEESEDGKVEEDKPSFQMTFDATLPSSHSYLGTDLEDVSGRTILDDDSCISLPIITLPNVVLVPGQTIPLHLFDQRMVAMMKSVLDKDKTFGVLASRECKFHCPTPFRPDNFGPGPCCQQPVFSYQIAEIGGKKYYYRYNADYSQSFCSVGTTAEIFSTKNETDEMTGISTIRVKAKGRQRFEVKETHREITGVLMAKVKILSEIPMEEPLEGARPPSHCKFCLAANEENFIHTAVDRKGNVIANVNMLNNRQVNKFSCAHLTWWPPWVYRMYDPNLVMKRIISEFQSWNNTLKQESFPQDPTEFSFWVCQNLPLNDNLRLHLLGINSTIQRLRCEYCIIDKCVTLCCADCDMPLANKNDMFSMSLEGPLGAYVNPGGYVHETLTVYKGKNISLRGRASTEHSWFPGYAWTIAECKGCGSHLGWKFTAGKKNLTPDKFFGFTRSAVNPRLDSTDEESSENWLPTM